MTDESAVAQFLDERPELASAMQTVLAVDEEADRWSFDEVNVGSGPFGELVDRGIVERVDGGYTVANPAAVREVLDEPSETHSSGEDKSDESLVSTSLPEVDRNRLLGIGGTLLFVVLLRTLFSLTAVFRNGSIVLSGNDPYYYRYVIESLVTDGGEEMLSLSTGVANGEPLFVISLAAASTLLGGSETAAGLVLAWYPVVSAVLTAAAIYVLAKRLTADRRSGLASVVMLAVLPAHAFRTSLGYADHHAFDYLLLGFVVLTLTELVSSTRSDNRQRRWALAVIFGMVFGSQILAWEAGPLLAIPVGAAVVFLTLLDVRANRSTLPWSGSLLAGIALGTLLVTMAHFLLGWHTPNTVLAPILLLCQVTAVIVIGEVTVRVDGSWQAGASTIVGSALTIAVAVWIALPTFWTRAMQQLGRLGAQRDIVETKSLLNADTGAWLLVFGFLLFLAVPVLAITTAAIRDGVRRWVVPTTYGWWLVGLTLFQIRFAGEASILVALFAGIGFLKLAAWVDLVEDLPLGGGAETMSRAHLTGEPRSGTSRGSLGVANRRTVISLVMLFVLVGGLSFLQVPIKTSQVTIDDQTYDTANWISDHAAAQNLTYPENYVLSQWGRNRVYNYFVNGESMSYSFAQSTYADFISSTRPDYWYHRLDDRVRFVVTSSVAVSEESLQQYLHEQYGVGATPGLSHYRAIYVTEDGSQKVFELVPGAVVTGPGKPNSTAVLTRKVDLGQQTIKYTRKVSVNEHGVYQIRVPYDGTYELGEKSVTIPQRVVEQGSVASQFSNEGFASWSFDEGDGSTAYDRSGGHHLTLNGTTWTDTAVNGSALAFSDGATATMKTHNSTFDEFTISFWVRPTSLNVNQNNNFQVLLTTNTGTPLVLEQDGDISFRLPNTDTSRLTGGNVSVGDWSHVAVTYDGRSREIYKNGTLVAADTVNLSMVTVGRKLTFGANSRGSNSHTLTGQLDEVTVYERSLSPEEVNVTYTSGSAGE
ncbi:LamG-like jellyroll fold domain-containing protein [Halosimplex amylolyticum]|uniref:LamG-like jellyroll fold domain-containing protein n=1 Tax=Halosimplex amylolyticum TaxID=3396616 RepID=UPI003F56064F